MIPEERTPDLEAARQLLLARRPELAERELRRYLAACPDAPQGHALLGWTLMQLGRGDEAVASAEEGVRLAPDWSYTHLVLAEIHLNLGDHARAEQGARVGVELDPYDGDAYATLAAALLNLGGLDRARQALRVVEDGLAQEPGNAACARLRAHTLSRLGRHAEARRAAAYALRVAPDTSEVHAAAGWIEMAAGDHGRGGELMREAVRLDPENESARKGLRKATYGERSAAAMLVQAQRWRWLLCAVAAAFVAEVVAVARRSEGDGLVFTLSYSLVMLGSATGAMLWARRRHPRLVEEMRLEGADGGDAKNARQMLLFLIFLLLFVPLTILAK